MKTILVPTDFSKNASQALDYAVALAKAENADIILVNAWQIVYPASDIVVSKEFTEKQLKEAHLSAFAQLKALSLKVKASHVPCNFFDKQGTLIKVILDLIEKHDIDLIIMGTKGARGLKELFLGTNTIQIMQKVNCPIIIVPKGSTFKGLKRIVYATNYQKSDIIALSQVVALARVLNAEITLLHVADEHYAPEEAKSILNLFSKQVSNKMHYENISYHILFGNDAKEELDEYVKRKRADLVVMSAPERKSLDHWFSRNIAKIMAYHTKMPLMVFHHQQNSIIFI